MYETTDALFTGICDAIRGKDGTTALISHQQIPARISAINGGGGGEAFTSPFYTYNGGGMKLENGVASNFSANSAIFLREAFLPGDSTWEIGVKFTYPDKLSKAANALFGSYNNWGTCPAVEFGAEGNLLKAFLGIPESNDILYQKFAIIAATLGETYWTKLKYDGQKYVLSLSEDGQVFDDIIQVEHAVMYQNADYARFQFGGFNRSSDHYFEGSIDLKETYIKIGDDVWWGKGVGA